MALCLNRTALIFVVLIVVDVFDVVVVGGGKTDFEKRGATDAERWGKVIQPSQRIWWQVYDIIAFTCSFN